MAKPVPLGGTIIVQKIEENNTTEGGILLSEGAVPQARRAVVIMVGPGRVTDFGIKLIPSVVPGDVVFLRQYAGADIKVGNATFTAIEEADILVKFEDDGKDDDFDDQKEAEPSATEQPASRILQI
jgi:chaperonin GroES